MQCTMVRYSVKLELRVDSAGESVVEPIKKLNRGNICCNLHRFMIRFPSKPRDILNCSCKLLLPFNQVLLCACGNTMKLL